MRIGILTYHSCLNYGANLQLYASVKSLEMEGHEVFVFDNLDYSPGPIRDFVERHSRLTERCRTDIEFREETNRLKLDVILVGSDAVFWFLPKATQGQGVYPNPFWLRWAKDLPVRKAVLAASCMGVMFPKCSGILRRQIREDLSAFDYVSVRDRWTQSFMRWANVKGSDLIFDPTSSLPSIVDFSTSRLPVGLERGRYILLTFSSSERVARWLQELTDEAHARGLKTCFISHPDHLCAAPDVDISISELMDPLEWLSLLANAAGYVGERFHPVILSAFFGTPFVSCDYYSKSGLKAIFNFRSKTRDFCKRIGAEKQIIPADRFFTKMTAGDVFFLLDQKKELLLEGCHVVFSKALKEAIRPDNQVGKETC